MSSGASNKIFAGYGTPLTRSWHEGDCALAPENLVYPIFITADRHALREIPSLPGQYHISCEKVVDFLMPLVKKGLRSVILFGVLNDELVKDANGTHADSPMNPVIRAIPIIRSAFSREVLTIICDVCLCAYTSHGHCGILTTSNPEFPIDNTLSTKRIAEIAAAYAAAGADIVAPSDMMDGRIAEIKNLLRTQNCQHIPVMSYAAKFASSFYGPFRGACATNLKGDRRQYQLPPGARGLAFRATANDVAAGADFVMVKPGIPYLDVVATCAQNFPVPIAVYHVSGEYMMILSAAKGGSIDLRAAVMETMVSFRRAGATIILTYFTPLILDWLEEERKRGPSKL
jgi:porphobilinogen synthase